MSVRRIIFFTPAEANGATRALDNISQDLRTRLFLHLMGSSGEPTPHNVHSPDLLDLLQQMQGMNPSSSHDLPLAPISASFKAPLLPAIKSEKWKNKKDVPEEFVCSIEQAGEAMKNPVYTRCQHVFERAAITQWVTQSKAECPLCRAATDLTSIKDWPELKHLIDLWKKNKPQPTAKKDSKQAKKTEKPTKKATEHRPAQRPVIQSRTITAPTSSGISRSRQVEILSRGTPSTAPRPQQRPSFFPANTTSTPQQDAHKLIDLAKFISKTPAAKQISLLDKRNKTSSDAFLTRPSFKQIFQNVYVLHRNQTGKNPSDPHFGSNAFYRRNKLDVSHEIRHQAIYLAALKQIGLAFEASNEIPASLQLFDQLPSKIRNEIYGVTYEFARLQDIPLQGSKAGELAFRSIDASHNMQRAIVIESYLQTKLTLLKK